MLEKSPWRDNEESDEGAPAWMVTYGDLMTLLLAFFVLFVSFFQVDTDKFAQFAGSMEQVFGRQSKVPTAPPATPPGPGDSKAVGTPVTSLQPSVTSLPSPTSAVPQTVATSESTFKAFFGIPAVEDHLATARAPAFPHPEGLSEPAALTSPAASLAHDPPIPERIASLPAVAAAVQDLLQTAETRPMIEVDTQDNYLIMRLLGQTTFASGKAELQTEFLPTLRAIGEILSKTSHDIFVAGHTDDMPVRQGAFKSNLELSVARAAAVVEFFVRYRLVAPDRIATMGFGEYRPRVPNTSEANREQNRRVDIILTAKPARLVPPSATAPWPVSLDAGR